MHAFRVPAACLAALIWVCTMARAEAHTFITVTVEMVADGDQLTVTVSVSPQDVIACLSPKAPATRGLIHALDGRLGPYLVQHVLMRIDGVAQAGRYGGYLPDLLQTSPAPRADEPLPDKLAFVMLWTLPANAAQINLGLTLFQEEQLPGVCHLALDPGGQGKRQIAYVELGKSWDFPLHPPRLPSSAVPLPPVGTSARRTSWWPLTLLPSPAGAMLTACSTTLALILALTLRDGWRQSRLLTLSAFAAALAAAAALVGSGVVAVGPRGSGLLAAGMILALSLGNLFPCPPSWWRWLAVAWCGLASGALSTSLFVPGHGGAAGLPGSWALPLVGCLLIELMALLSALVLLGKIGMRPWYQARLVAPLSLLMASTALLALVQLLSAGAALPG